MLPPSARETGVMAGCKVSLPGGVPCLVVVPKVKGFSEVRDEFGETHLTTLLFVAV